MPVTNKWKERDAANKAAAEAAAAAAAAKVEPPKEEAPPAGLQGRRLGRLQNLKTGGKAADTKPAEPSPPVVEETNGKEEKGRRNVASKWSAPKEETNVRRKRLEVSDEPVDDGQTNNDTISGIDPITGGIMLENQPIRLEGVVRSDDPSEFQKPLELQKGFAKNLASRFMNAQNDEASSQPRRFKMDVEAGEPAVHENEPVRLEGVVRAADRTEDVIGKRGTIRSIAGRFANPQPESSSSDSDSDDDDRRPPARRPVGSFNRDRSGSNAGEPVVLSENTPTELDPSVVRSSDGYRANDPVMEAGSTRNMAERWKMQQEQDAATPASRGGGGKGAKPAWLIELENAKESEHGVFENEPEVRDDVVHADDEKPDIISVQHTRSLRKMWNQIEKDSEAADKQPKNRPLPRVKEPSPEPEPPKPPPEEPKPAVGRFGAGRGGRTIGRLNMGHLQKEEPKPPAQPVEEPPAPAARGGFGARGRRMGAAAAAAPAPVAPQPVPEPETKASKLYNKPTFNKFKK